MLRNSRRAETHHPLDNRSLEGRPTHVPPKDLTVTVNFFGDFYFWMHSLQGLLLEGTIGALSHASVSPPAHPGQLGCRHMSSGKMD